MRIRGLKFVALGTGMVAAILAAGAPFAHASPNAAEDGPDVFNVAKGTAVSATTSKVVISLPSASLLITCTASSFGGHTGASLMFSVGLPAFNDGSGKPCNDTLGFSDSFKASTAGGAWTLSEKDATGDEGLPEPNATGDRMMLRIPKSGLTDTNNWPCSIVFAPTAPSSISGSYNDAGMFVVKGAKVPVSVSGPSFCGPAAQTATISATYRLTPAIFDRG